ncbi:toprim domain-containing protein [Microbulbifer spongiae]|uniref:Toprim domain-containing protein n=1 Tax=Microbulbifer spongiae TaxID=2944933 RepID=A0ABY9EF69_9GAMM|nr:toprim domain-containing protein [Microbulbifer sp. MI-G]WKD51041.1 toprim domain-containing protein [Microbulbifer sp. MI-G]
MIELLNTYQGHPSAVYDLRWLGYADFPEIDGDNPTNQTLIDQVFAYYQEALFYNPRALDFLRQLGIEDAELLKRLGIGFADRTLGKQLPLGRTKAGALIRGNLQRLGMFVGSGGEFFRGTLVFPNRNEHGEITEAYGERITPRLRPGTLYHLYWSVQSAGFYNVRALHQFQEIILCKNPLEALILLSAGYRNVVATLGLRGFGTEHLEALAGSRARSVTIAFDGTVKGDQTSRLVAQALSTCGVECSRLAFPAGMDLKGYVLEHGTEALRFLVSGAQPCAQTYEALREDGLC